LLKRIHLLLKKISSFFYGATIVTARLFGVREISPGKFEAGRLYSAAWAFLIGLPLGLILIGTEFSIIIWAAIILASLLIINLDESLLLMVYYIENGTTGEETYQEEQKCNT